MLGATLGEWVESSVSAPPPPTNLTDPDPYTGLTLDPDGSGKMGLMIRAEELVRLGPSGIQKVALTLPRRGYCDPMFLDLNGDGLSDWVGRKPSSNTIGIAINTGNGFQEVVEWSLPSQYQSAYGQPSFPVTCDRNMGSGAHVIDFNQDGRQDLLLMAGYKVGSAPGDETTAPRQLLVLISTGNAFVAQSVGISAGDPSSWGTNTASAGPKYTYTGPIWNQSHTFDVNGDGLGDFVQRFGAELRVYTRNGIKSDLLKRATDGLGAYEVFDYVPISSGHPFYFPATDCRYPLQCVTHGLWVVANHGVDNGEVLPVPLATGTAMEG